MFSNKHLFLFHDVFCVIGLTVHGQVGNRFRGCTPSGPVAASADASRTHHCQPPGYVECLLVHDPHVPWHNPHIVGAL